MEAKELRIGNYVLEKGRLVRIHDGFGIDHAHNFEPIPLTPEWLERLGFNDMADNGEQWAVNGANDDFCLLFTGNEFVYEFENYQWQINNLVVEYVHQLQNLYFALTGKELELKTNF